MACLQSTDSNYPSQHGMPEPQPTADFGLLSKAACWCRKAGYPVRVFVISWQATLYTVNNPASKMASMDVLAVEISAVPSPQRAMYAHKHALTLLTISICLRRSTLLLKSVRLVSQMMEVALLLLLKTLLRKASQIGQFAIAVCFKPCVDFPLKLGVCQSLIKHPALKLDVPAT